MSGDSEEISILQVVKSEPRDKEESEDEDEYNDKPLTMEDLNEQTSRLVRFNIDNNRYYSPPKKALKSILRNHNDHSDQNQSTMSRRKSFGIPSNQVGQGNFNPYTNCNHGFHHQMSSASVYPPHHPHYPFGFTPYWRPPPPPAPRMMSPYPQYFPQCPPCPPCHHYYPQIRQTQQQQIHQHQPQKIHQTIHQQKSDLPIPVKPRRTLVKKDLNSTSSAHHDSDDLNVSRKSKSSKKLTHHSKVSQSEQESNRDQNVENIENGVKCNVTPSGHAEKTVSKRRLTFDKVKKSRSKGDAQGGGGEVSNTISASAVETIEKIGRKSHHLPKQPSVQLPSTAKKSERVKTRESKKNKSN